MPKIINGTELPRKTLMTEYIAPIKVKNINNSGLKFINLFTILSFVVSLKISFLDKVYQYWLYLIYNQLIPDKNWQV